jgi:hypothetical protein
MMMVAVDRLCFTNVCKLADTAIWLCCCRVPAGGPGAPSSAVGYHVRLDASVTNSTQLLFCTTGILLRR